MVRGRRFITRNCSKHYWEITCLCLDVVHHYLDYNMLLSISKNNSAFETDFTDFVRLYRKGCVYVMIESASLTNSSLPKEETIVSFVFKIALND